MATLTVHLALVKPDLDDLVDAETHISDNYDTLDAAILTMNTIVTQLSASVTELATIDGGAPDTVF